jgi:hypothetical protein
MGVFEQQHCNYEQVFGQALSLASMWTARRPRGKYLKGLWELAMPRRGFRSTAWLTPGPRRLEA